MSLDCIECESSKGVDAMKKLKLHVVFNTGVFQHHPWSGS